MLDKVTDIRDIISAVALTCQATIKGGYASQCIICRLDIYASFTRFHWALNLVCFLALGRGTVKLLLCSEFTCTVMKYEAEIIENKPCS